MAVIVKLPKCGINMEEGLIANFLVCEGDMVTKGQPLAELETDKTVTEITAPEDGCVLKILCDAGEYLPILTPVLAIGAQGETFTDQPEPVVRPGTAEPEAEAKAAPGSAVPAPVPAFTVSESRVKASPLAKKIAAEMGIDLREVAGTGPENGILRRDVLLFASAQLKAATAGFGVNCAQVSAWDLPVKNRIPLKGMRKAIAGNMSRSKAVIPHFTLTTSIDMGEAMALRSKFKAHCGLRLSYNDILAKAAACAIQKNPAINSSMGEGEILQFEPVNVGIAVGLDNGLIVPVVKGVDSKPLTAVVQESAALIEKARAGQLSPDACTNGTITISNLGMYEIDRFSAIINMPESCILAVGKIEDRPVGRNGEIVLRPMMDVTASFDHRIIDGVVGAQFLTDLKHCMEHPFCVLS